MSRGGQEEILSKLEEDEIGNSIFANFRFDGRTNFSYRTFLFEELNPNSETSFYARKLGPTKYYQNSFLFKVESDLGKSTSQGENELVPPSEPILVSHIFLEIITPPLDRPNEGKLYFSIKTNSITEKLISDKQRFDVMNLLNEIFLKAIDLENLSIVIGEKVFKINIEFEILQTYGNFYDLFFYSAFISLKNLKIPFFKKRTLQNQFLFDDETTNSSTSQKAKSIDRLEYFTFKEKNYRSLFFHFTPILVSFYFIHNKKRKKNVFFVDPNVKEFMCSKNNVLCLVIAVSNRGGGAEASNEIIYLRKMGKKNITLKNLKKYKEIAKLKVVELKKCYML